MTINQEKLNEALAYVKHHNDWRKGADIKMCDPRELSIALDLIMEAAQRYAELEKENAQAQEDIKVLREAVSGSIKLISSKVIANVMPKEQEANYKALEQTNRGVK